MAVYIQELLIYLHKALVDLGKSLIDLGESLVDLSKSLIDLIKALVDLVKAPVDLRKSLLDLRKPLIDLRKPLIDLSELLINMHETDVDALKSLVKALVKVGQALVHPAPEVRNPQSHVSSQICHAVIVHHHGNEDRNQRDDDCDQLSIRHTEIVQNVPRSSQFSTSAGYFSFSSWYSISVFTAQRLDLSVIPAAMLSTAVMAVSMEWSWLLYLCIPLRPTRNRLPYWLT